MGLLADFKRAAADLLFPPLCLLCGERCEGGSLYLCEAHEAGIERLAPPLCRRCGHPFPAEIASPRCAFCRGDSLHFFRARSAAAYRGPVRDLLLAWKLGGKRAAVYPFADWAVEALRREGWEAAVDLASFVPLYRRKERQRGFNQAEDLAREIAFAVGKPLRRTLVRVRETAPQGEPTTLSRRENVRGAFAPAPRHGVGGKTVLLVDDVFTSGATAAECAKTLRAAGARRVLVLTVARGGAGHGLVPSPAAAQNETAP